MLAAHNAYHLEGEEALLDAITAGPARAHAHHRVLPSHRSPSSSTSGCGRFELDLFEDPDGGRYAAPKAQALLGLEPIDPVMQEPGFKVFHIQEVDYRSTCLTFVACLTELEAWSDDHPDHLPLVIHLEAKDGEIPDPLDLGFVQPIPVTEGTFTAIEEEIRSVLDDDQLVTVADVQGDADDAARRDRGRRLARRGRPARPVRVRARRPRRQARALPRASTPTRSTG